MSGGIYGHSMLYPNIGLYHPMITTQEIVDIDQRDISSDPISHCTSSQLWP